MIFLRRNKLFITKIIKNIIKEREITDDYLEIDMESTQRVGKSQVSNSWMRKRFS